METKAKREYNQILSELLKKGDEEKLIEKLETLRLFIESSDFNKLRSESEKHLLKGRRVKFILRLVEGKPKCEMKVI